MIIKYRTNIVNITTQQLTLNQYTIVPLKISISRHQSSESGGIPSSASVHLAGSGYGKCPKRWPLSYQQWKRTQYHIKPMIASDINMLDFGTSFLTERYTQPVRSADVLAGVTTLPDDFKAGRSALPADRILARANIDPHQDVRPRWDERTETKNL